jgi:hypothetical protein
LTSQRIERDLWRYDGGLHQVSEQPSPTEGEEDTKQAIVEVETIYIDNGSQIAPHRNEKAARGRPVALRALGQTKRSMGESFAYHTHPC